MGDIIKAIEFLGIPATIAIGVVGLFLVSQIIGEFCEFCGKVVPEFMKVRKYFKRKRDEREKRNELLKNVETLLIKVGPLFNNVEQHYNEDNITQRNQWIEKVNDNMDYVHERAKVYDESILKLTDGLNRVTNQLNTNNNLTAEMFVQHSRDRIFDFAGKCGSDDAVISKEEFHRIFKVHKKYEDFLAQHNMENGEVDSAFAIIQQAFEYRIKHHSFLEDIRGCNNTTK